MYAKPINWDREAPTNEDQTLNPIQGIVVGLAISLSLWAGIIGAVIYALSS
jgi:hypothetical protein